MKNKNRSFLLTQVNQQVFTISVLYQSIVSVALFNAVYTTVNQNQSKSIMNGRNSDIETPFLDNNGAENDEKVSLSPWRLCQRILIAVIGIFLGLITLLPNAMMASFSLMAARIGIAASVSFMVAGVIGACRVEWRWLAIGLFLQVLALLWGEIGIGENSGDHPLHYNLIID